MMLRTGGLKLDDPLIEANTIASSSRVFDSYGDDHGHSSGDDHGHSSDDDHGNHDGPDHYGHDDQDDDEVSEADAFLASLTWLPHVKALTATAEPIADPIPVVNPSPAPVSTVTNVPSSLKKNLLAYGVIVCVLAAASGAVNLGKRILNAPAPKPHPAVWDPRIQPMVNFIEKETGAPFKHPIAVQFVDAQAFSSLWILNAPDGAMKTKNRDGFMMCADVPSSEFGDCGLFKRIMEPSFESMYLRFLGVDIALKGAGQPSVSARSSVARPVDSFALRLQKNDVIGFYDPKTITIYVRGKDLAGVQQTVAHELTHAWQDQHHLLSRSPYEVDRTYARLAMTEGHAELIGNRWVASLSQDQRDIISASDDEAEAQWKAEEEQLRGPQEPESQHPTARTMEMILGSWPYISGPKFFASRSAPEIQRLLQHPPKSTWSIFNPNVSDTGRGAQVSSPKVTGPHYTRKKFTVGPLLWTIGMLASDLSAEDAELFRATWKGDAAVIFQDRSSMDRGICMSDRIQFVSPEARTKAHEVLLRWTHSHAGGRATIGTVGTSEVLATMCVDNYSLTH